MEARLEAAVASAVRAVGGAAVKIVGLRGFPDRLFILPGGVVWFVEFKSPTGRGRFEPRQRKWGERLRALGCNYAVIDDLQQGLATLGVTD